MGQGVYLHIGGTLPNSPNPFVNSSVIYATSGFSYGITEFAYPRAVLPAWTIVDNGVVRAATGTGVSIGVEY